MTAGELIRSARSRASLSQADLAKALSTPRSQIARWEAGDVEPGFATVRRVLRACGFDLSMALVPFDPDAPREARLVELQRLTPKERLDQALVRGGATTMGYDVDPCPILGVLEEHGVDHILIGSLARVLQGADEIPATVDVCVPRRARLAADEALQAIGQRAPGAMSTDGRALVYSRLGLRITVAVEPEGTKGFDDLRRKAERIHLGQGLRPRVASPGDLVRMLEALQRPDALGSLEAMRRVVELDRGFGLRR
jgi:transcriptional regulator with XRE-family HTH domain